MFNPIAASKAIKDEFISYISTLYQISGKDYANSFKNELQKEGAITKGPYLELNDSFKKGKMLSELISINEISSLFQELEAGVDEKEKELQLERELFLHQEEAIKKINANRNLIVTTGTGSGKTECFIIPIINHLLREKENKKLSAGVRAILIYPMNALANDQMKRLRKLLKNYPDITFGVYNGDTAHNKEDGIDKYKNTFGKEPLPNEVLSRDIMQTRPPHILVTNYSMLEFMLLRPKDDIVFSGADLKFIVLDEAHIYRGATGIETSLLLSRLKARISNPNNVLHILTSATLGDKSSDNDIVKFAKSLCNADFDVDDIIRSQTELPQYHQKMEDFPLSLFSNLANPVKPLNKILEDYNLTIPEGQSDEEFLYDLCCRSRIYRKLREIINKPMIIPEIIQEFNKTENISEQNIVDIISVAVKAYKNNTALVKARYHFFAKALEGAYITLSPEKNLFLTRKTNHKDENEENWKVFECACCDDCGKLAILGTEKNGKLEFANSNKEITYNCYLIDSGNDNSLEDEESDEILLEENGIGENDFVLCPRCGAIIHKSNESEIKCNCKEKNYINVKKLIKNEKSHDFKCTSCGSGKLKTFYLGYDAATAVLGTTLYEQIPEREIELKSKKHEELPNNNPFANLKRSEEKVSSRKKEKQFLAFSDSRSEAAYFASYMTKSYQEFLRRRGIWHVVENNRDNMVKKPWEIKSFVEELTNYFDDNRTFAEPGDNNSNLTTISRENAWIAVLNEMVNARRGSSLSSLGIIKFHFKGNDQEAMEAIGSKYNLSVEDMTALFDLLVMDIVYHGAIVGDCKLSSDEKEYIYYTPVQKFVKNCKDSSSNKTDKNNNLIMSWMAPTYKNGNYRRNSRLKRIMDHLKLNEEDANELLKNYWDFILLKYLISYGDNDKHYLETNSFTISSYSENGIWICDKCGKKTMHNCQNKCSVVSCDGNLKPISHQEIIDGNHYANLYASSKMKPLHIREHTAQLGRKEQRKYQEMFVKKELNALSCSTTFEMGVDVGDLETIYLRNVPPSPANYVQRAGRAGRSLLSAAFALTYAKMASHDFTYYNNPEDMIMGKIGVPLFEITNEKIILRHIFAVTLSKFFQINDDVYNGNNADVFLNGNGYERLCEYLNSKPSDLRMMLEISIPTMHREMGITDFSWKDKLIGEEGILKNAVEDYRETIDYYLKEIKRLIIEGKEDEAGIIKGKLRNYRRNKEDDRGKNELIEFFVRNNVLPKYGFPVDNVELYQNINSTYDDKKLSLNRDLQIAIYEYAPDAQIVADGKLYTSRYIRKLMAKTGYNWETSYIAKCQNDSCNTWNYSKIKPSDKEKCISCGFEIEKKEWKIAIEPRKGFVAELGEPKDAPMRKPDRTYKSDDFYIGGDSRKVMQNLTFASTSNSKIELESSTNDSLMVVCSDDFYVCNQCGYSESRSQNKEKDATFKSFEKIIEKPHKNPYGKNCSCESLNKYKLCHVFKTDVVKIIFRDNRASNKNTMLSVLYALLEALSSVLNIERNDIKGCLHGITYKGKYIYSIILYDAVAGGAGHVRRIMSQSGDKLTKVIEKAIEITMNCDCSPSCYKCLRNYYNQKIHDLLDRSSVFDFLTKYSGKIQLIEKKDVETD